MSELKQIDTPRTDEESFDHPVTGVPVVASSFARQLERENQRLRCLLACCDDCPVVAGASADCVSICSHGFASGLKAVDQRDQWRACATDLATAVRVSVESYQMTLLSALEAFDKLNTP